MKLVSVIFYPEPHPILFKNKQTRPISDEFRKNNANYLAFMEIRSIIPHS